MKKFYDREQEMARLRDVQRQVYDDCSRLVVLTGRRRVGKTSLVYRLLQEWEAEAPGLYFFVGRKTEAVLVENFAEEVRSTLGEFVPEGINTMRGLMQLLLEIGKRRKFTVFIDEFQDWDIVNAGVFSDIQELWDRYKKETRVCLIVSGSIFRMMEKIFKDEQQPLFGRDDCTIRLMPFSTTTIREILADHKPDYTNEDLLALWTITGGVARYIELLMNNGCTDAEKMIRYVCSSGDSFFVNEGKSILIQEFGRQYGTYFSILGQIARGDVSQSEIEAALGMKSLGGQLRILEENYAIIRKKRPIGAKPGSQTVRFEIEDNFFRFWFRYIYRYSSLIEIQNMKALEQIMIDDYTTFSGIALERWFRQKMMESCQYQKIGGWWKSGGKNRKGNTDDFEIDIVTETLNGDVEAYEVKRNAQRYNPHRLTEKVEEMKRHLFKGKNVAIKGLSMDDM
ncbi:MAG: ATP-binding protein [Bacteroidales bacterium]|nr:ATP-binding protein [Bacteroidales bacterium]